MPNSVVVTNRVSSEANCGARRDILQLLDGQHCTLSTVRVRTNSLDAIFTHQAA